MTETIEQETTETTRDQQTTEKATPTRDPDTGRFTSAKIDAAVEQVFGASAEKEPETEPEEKKTDETAGDQTGEAKAEAAEADSAQDSPWTPTEIEVIKSMGGSIEELAALPPEVARKSVDLLLRADQRVSRLAGDKGRLLREHNKSLAQKDAEIERLKAAMNGGGDDESDVMTTRKLLEIEEEYGPASKEAREARRKFTEQNSTAREEPDEGERLASAEVAEIEKALTSLPPDVYGTGKGATGDMPEDAPEARQRLHIFRQAMDIRMSLPGLTWASAIRRAADLVVPLAKEVLDRRRRSESETRLRGGRMDRPGGVGAGARMETQKEREARIIKEKAEDIAPGFLQS